MKRRDFLAITGLMAASGAVSTILPSCSPAKVAGEKVENFYDTDVLVIGGGPAGVCAALAAAREGVRVMIVETGGCLGGMATRGLVGPFMTCYDTTGEQMIIRGLFEEIVDRMVAMGGAIHPSEVRAGTPFTAWIKAGHDHLTPFEPEAMKFVLDQMCQEAGIKVLFHSTFVSPVMKSNRIQGAVIMTKAGLRGATAKVVIDATGDADVCYLSGAKCELHGEGNVLASWYYSVAGGEYKLNQLGFCDVSDEEKRAGKTVPMLTNRRFSGVDAEEVSEMVEMSHASLLNNFIERKRTQSDILPVNIATIPQLRMTRKLVGEHVLDKSEVHTYQETSVGLISDWRKRGPIYEIPFGTLYSNEVKNLAVAGRCISVTDAMWDVTRVIPVCAVTGEAAGIAAAMTDDITALDLAALQNELRARGVKLHESEIL